MLAILFFYCLCRLLFLMSLIYLVWFLISFTYFSDLHIFSSYLYYPLRLYAFIFLSLSEWFLNFMSCSWVIFFFLLNYGLPLTFLPYLIFILNIFLFFLSFFVANFDGFILYPLFSYFFVLLSSCISITCNVFLVMFYKLH